MDIISRFSSVIDIMVMRLFLYGHLRKEQLVKHWEGATMNVDITRKIPPGEAVYERYVSGNPPPKK